jgi:hypothetical protein
LDSGAGGSNLGFADEVLGGMERIAFMNGFQKKNFMQLNLVNMASLCYSGGVNSI